MNKKTKIAIIVFLIVLATGMASASSNVNVLRWIISGRISGKTLWLNFTEADNWGSEKPENICFGLANGSACISLNTTGQQLNMYNESIINVSWVNTTNIIAENYCLDNGSCYNLTELIGGGGSGDANEYTVVDIDDHTARMQWVI